MRLGIPTMLVLALMAGGCRRESFDDQWHRKSDEASKTASAMERDMQARLRVAQQAGHGLDASAVEAASSGP
ncbi:hypothetical protein FHW96_001293 [Novosphingobium sp. SG751A]|uniref:hypothetical protein n=1 Tax=Novosphingobium sp. SG751A TaxID=2587000 RepID=UPI0015530D31|nr:hypothetical protein [Novosphingobium sp. SG751A]NOW45138.1 hypothetical protein [Novosphingobium sp. SG751A]